MTDEDAPRISEEERVRRRAALRLTPKRIKLAGDIFAKGDGVRWGI